MPNKISSNNSKTWQELIRDHPLFYPFYGKTQIPYKHAEDEFYERVNGSGADWINRLLTGNRAHIKNDDGTVSTHLLSYATNGDNAIVYPEIQSTSAGVRKITNNPLGRAIKNNDVVNMTADEAAWFTKNYKDYYKQFDKLKEVSVSFQGFKDYVKKHTRYKYDDDQLRYMYNHLGSTNFDADAVGYVIKTESDYNPHIKNPVSSAQGFLQLTDDTKKKLFGDSWESIKKQYVNNTRSISKVMDDALTYVNSIASKIKTDSDNLGAGRLKINLLAPNSSMSSSVSNAVYNTLPKDVKNKIIPNQSTYSDLAKIYDQKAQDEWN